MTSTIRCRILLMVMIASLITGVSVTAAQNEPRFLWDDLTVTVALQQDASLRITERLQVRFFGGPFWEVYRDIPLAHVDDIKDIEVTEISNGPLRRYDLASSSASEFISPDSYSVERREEVLRVRWGFPPTSSRSRTFVLAYEALGALSVHDDAQPPYQQIIWAAVGPELTASALVNHARLNILLPYAAVPGTTVASGAAQVVSSNEGQFWSWQATGLGPGQELVGSLRFAPQVPAEPPAWQTEGQRLDDANTLVNRLLLGVFLLTLLGGGGFLLAAWWIWGRDPIVTTMTPLSTDSQALDPAGIVGSLLDEYIDTQDRVATLVDLGQRGVLLLENRPSDIDPRSRGTVATYLEPETPLAPFQLAFIEMLFGESPAPGQQATLPDRGSARLEQGMERVDRLLGDELVHRGYFRQRPARTRATWRYIALGMFGLIAVGVAAVMVADLDLPLTAVLLVVILLEFSLFSISLARYMPQKTLAGAAAATQWRLFRRHLQEGESGHDLPRASATFNTFLPYAVAFGFERPWIARFSQLPEVEGPSWFHVVSPGTPSDGRDPGGPVVAARDAGRDSGTSPQPLREISDALVQTLDAASLVFAVRGGLPFQDVTKPGANQLNIRPRLVILRLTDDNERKFR